MKFPQKKRNIFHLKPFSPEKFWSALGNMQVDKRKMETVHENKHYPIKKIATGCSAPVPTQLNVINYSVLQINSALQGFEKRQDPASRAVSGFPWQFLQHESFYLPGWAKQDSCSPCCHLSVCHTVSLEQLWHLFSGVVLGTNGEKPSWFGKMEKVTFREVSAGPQMCSNNHRRALEVGKKGLWEERMEGRRSGTLLWKKRSTDGLEEAGTQAGKHVERGTVGITPGLKSDRIWPLGMQEG